MVVCPDFIEYKRGVITMSLTHENLEVLEVLEEGVELGVVQLLPLGLSTIRLTIDGPPDIHDAQRPFVSGAGSFKKIMTNLLTIYKLVAVDLGGNYTRDNYRRFPELLDMLIEQGIDPARMKEVSFSPVMPKADGSVAGDRGSTGGTVGYRSGHIFCAARSSSAVFRLPRSSRAPA